MVPCREVYRSLSRTVPFTVGGDPGVCIAWVLLVTDVSVVALLGFEMGLGRGFGCRATAFLVGEIDCFPAEVMYRKYYL